jgi:hypothetical protein
MYVAFDIETAGNARKSWVFAVGICATNKNGTIISSQSWSIPPTDHHDISYPDSDASQSASSEFASIRKYSKFIDPVCYAQFWHLHQPIMDTLFNAIPPEPKSAADIWREISAYIDNLYATDQKITIIADCPQFDLPFIEDRIESLVPFNTFISGFGLQYKFTLQLPGRDRLSLYNPYDMLHVLPPDERSRVKEDAARRGTHSHLPAEDAHHMIVLYLAARKHFQMPPL